MDGREAGKYLQEWHDRHPGATSMVLGAMSDHAGRSSYRGLVDAIRQGVEPILDIACGDGHLLELLRPQALSVGIDWNVAELDAARRRLGRSIPLVRADAARLPFATGAVGTVSCHFALMLLQPLETVLAEMARVLRSGGMLAAVLPASPPEGVDTLWDALRGSWRDVTALHPVEIPSLQDGRALRRDVLASLLEESGFTSLAMESFSVSKMVTVEEAKEALLLTYLPDLLPPDHFSQLEQALECSLLKMVADNGKAIFIEHADLVTAHRR
jgi:ubiquinone/menaquinone biosynthesis C-methylase UbiE